MHKFFHVVQDTYISSGSNVGTTGVSERDQNFGKDAILELKKVFFNKTYNSNTRVLVQFNNTEIKNYISSSNISSGNYSASLRLYESNGTQGLSEEYSISVHPLLEQWAEGVGKFGDDPKTTDGCSYTFRTNVNDISQSWTTPGGTIADVSASFMAGQLTQSFKNESPDININITSILQAQLDGVIPNYGFLLKLSGSIETRSTSFEDLKFFSGQTNTIYNPRIELKHDDHVIATGSATGSLLPLDTTGTVDNYLYKKSFRESYKVNETARFRFGARQRYITKTFSTSVQETSGSYIPEGSGSYSIVDLATGETVVPFSSYTTMSVDNTSPYFIQDLSGFYPQRAYKILVKISYDNNEEYIFDDGYEFIVRN